MIQALCPNYSIFHANEDVKADSDLPLLSLCQDSSHTTCSLVLLMSMRSWLSDCDGKGFEEPLGRKSTTASRFPIVTLSRDLSQLGIGTSQVEIACLPLSFIIALYPSIVRYLACSSSTCFLSPPSATRPLAFAAAAFIFAFTPLENLGGVDTTS